MDKKRKSVRRELLRQRFESRRRLPAERSRDRSELEDGHSAPELGESDAEAGRGIEPLFSQRRVDEHYLSALDLKGRLSDDAAVMRLVLG